MNRKSQGLSLEVIITAAIVLIVLILLWAILTGRFSTSPTQELTPEGCVENPLETYLGVECVNRSGDGVMVWEKIKDINCSYYTCELTEEKQTPLDLKVCGGYEDTYKAICKDVERFETIFEYQNLSMSEIEQIQTFLIEPIKPFYLYGIRKITFEKAKIGYYSGEHSNLNISLMLDPRIGHEVNLWVMCHEILHRYGLFDSEVMNDIDEKLPCYR